MKLSASRTFTCKIYYWVTPRLAAGINRWGIPRGVAVHYSTGGRIGSSTFEGKWRRDTLSGVWQRLRVAVDAADRIQGAYLHFLKSVDLDYAYTQIASGGAQLRSARNIKRRGGFSPCSKVFLRSMLRTSSFWPLLRSNAIPTRLSPQLGAMTQPWGYWGSFTVFQPFPCLKL